MFKSNTDIAKTGHTVRLGTRGMVYYLDTGQELDKQCDYRNRPGTPFPSCPADIRYSNRHIKVKHMLFTFFSSTEVTLIIVLVPESESCHDSKGLSST